MERRSLLGGLTAASFAVLLKNSFTQSGTTTELK
jgi:hypothetical protein